VIEYTLCVICAHAGKYAVLYGSAASASTTGSTCTVVEYSSRHSGRYTVLLNLDLDKKRSRGAAVHENIVEPFISDTQDP
jgi:hypothetical protein